MDYNEAIDRITRILSPDSIVSLLDEEMLFLLKELLVEGEASGFSVEEQIALVAALAKIHATGESYTDSLTSLPVIIKQLKNN